MKSNKNFWQHPFVDVFKLNKVLETKDSNSKKEGSTHLYQDKIIGRMAIKVGGTAQAKNQVLVPENQERFPLNQVGKVVQVQMLLPPGKNFNFHIHFNSADERDTQQYRLTVSNISKKSMTVGGRTTIRLCPDSKWTVCCIHLGDIAKQLFNVDAHYITGFQFCGYAHQRGVFTSDVQQAPELLPKDLSFRITKLDNWYELQDFFNLTKDTSTLLKPDPYTYKPISPLREDQNIDNIISNIQNTKEAKTKQARNNNTLQDKSIEKNRMGNTGMSMPKSTNDTTDEQVKKLINSEVNPDPVIDLAYVNCMQSSTDNSVMFSRSETELSTVQYSGGAHLVKLDLSTQQSSMQQSSNNLISCIAQNQNGTYLATAEDTKEPYVTIYSMEEFKVMKTFPSEVMKVTCLCFSNDSSLLGIFGLDDHNRTKAIVYDIASIHHGKDPLLIARQLTDYDVICAKFSPIESNVIVSVGRENMRFYRIKKGHLPGKPVVLNHQARNSVFTCLDQECSYNSANQATDASMKKVFVGSDKGLVFQLNQKSAEVEAVFKCHNTAIRSIKCNPAQVATGGDDCFLRVWPFDFSEFFIEAKHSGSVTNIDIKLDGLQILACTDSGNLGLLDVSTQGQNTKLRAAHGNVVDMDSTIDSNGNLTIAAISSKDTVKVFTDKNDGATFLEQTCEFQSTEDQPTCLAQQPGQNQVAVGFDSGWLRIFDITHTSVLKSLKISETELLKLQFFNNLLFMMNVDSLTVLDSTRDYQPIKMHQFQNPPVNKSVDFIQVKTNEAIYMTIGEFAREIVVFDQTYFRLKNKVVSESDEFTQVKCLYDSSSNQHLAVALTTENSLLTYNLSTQDGELQLTLLNLMGRHPLCQFEISSIGEHFFCGSIGLIRVFNKCILTAKTQKKLKSIPMYQEFRGHAGTINKITQVNDFLVSSSNSKDGFLVWKFKGSYTQRLRNETQEGVNRVEEQIRDLDFSGDVTQDEIDRVVAKKPVSYKSPESFDRDQSKKNFDSTLERDENSGSIMKPQPAKKDFTTDQMLGFSGLGPQCFFWDKARGIIMQVCNNLAIKESLSTKQQLIYSHCPTNLLRLTCNLAKQQLQTVHESEGNLVISLCKLDDDEVLQEKLIPGNKVLGIQVDSQNENLVVSVQNQKEQAVYILTSQLEEITAMASTIPIVTAKWSIFGKQVFLVLQSNSLKLYRLTETGLQCKEMNLKTFGTQFNDQEYSALNEALVGSQTQNASHLIFVGTTEGTIHVYDFKDCEILQSTDCVQGGVINFVGVFTSHCVVGGNSPILNSYPHPNIAQVHSARQVLFYSKPDVLLLDNSASEVALSAEGKEGLVATIDCTIWQVNYEENATVRLISSHFARINSVDILTEYKNDQSFIKPNNWATSSEDKTIRVWSLDNYDQIVAFRQKTTPTCVRFSTFYKNIVMVGSMDGTLNFLSIKNVNSLQTLPVSASPVFSILELDEDSVIVVGQQGELTLVYNDMPYDPSGERINFKCTTFPSLNQTVTCVARCELEPDQRFLICTSNGFVTTQIRTCDDQEVKRGVQTEFTAIDSWDLLDNPNDLKNEDEIMIHRKLVKRRDVIIQAVFRLSAKHKHLVGIGEDLCWVQIRDYEQSVRLSCISMAESPKLIANVSENQVQVTVNDDFTIVVDLHTKRRDKVLEEGKTPYDSVTVSRKKNKIFYTSGINVIVKKGF